MKRFIVSLIVLCTLTMGITVVASEYDCELKIDATKHNEENPAFPTSGCEDLPALGWYADGEYMLSGFSGMESVTNGEVIDLGMDTTVKVITIDKESKSKKEKSTSTKKNAENKSNDKKEESKTSEVDNDTNINEEEKKQKTKKEVKTDKVEDQGTKKKSEKKQEVEQDEEEEAIETSKEQDNEISSNPSANSIFIITLIVLVGIFIAFWLRREKKSH